MKIKVLNNLLSNPLQKLRSYIGIEKKKSLMKQKTKVEQIIDEIQRILPKLESKIHNITNGGCGVFAYLLWKRLKELGYENIKAYPLIHREPSEVHTKFNKIANREIDPIETSIGFNHIILSIEQTIDNTVMYVIDSEGIEKVSKIKQGCCLSGNITSLSDGNVGEPLSFELLEKLALYNKRGLWNDCFNREQIPEMKKIIDDIHIPV